MNRAVRHSYSRRFSRKPCSHNLECAAAHDEDSGGKSMPRLRAKGPPHTSLGHRPRYSTDHETKGLKARFIFPPRSQSSKRSHAMPQSLSLVLLHLVFSTKDRTPCLEKPIRPGLNKYLAKVARN